MGAQSNASIPFHTAGAQSNAGSIPFHTAAHTHVWEQTHDGYCCFVCHKRLNTRDDIPRLPPGGELHHRSCHYRRGTGSCTC